MRRALIEQARREQDDAARREATEIAADPAERAEARAILAFFSEEAPETG